VEGDDAVTLTEPGTESPSVTVMGIGEVVGASISEGEEISTPMA
jgi:hypothetical protein